MQRPLRNAFLLVFLFCAIGGHRAMAAESYDNCSGFIDSLPATIGKQGVWCLRKDLSTALTSGAAITVATNNVTIDCNDFKIGGLAAGESSTTTGISATDRQNITVRHCNVRGFYAGIWLAEGAGHLVEDNRLDNNLFMSIYVTGDNSLIRSNRVFDTGSQRQFTYGIFSAGDVVDNTISGVFASGEYPHGIVAWGSASTIQGNSIRGLVAGEGTGSGPLGIAIATKGVIVDRNRISATTSWGSGIGRYTLATADADATCSHNIVRGFADNYAVCVAEVGNIDLP